MAAFQRWRRSDFVNCSQDPNSGRLPCGITTQVEMGRYPRLDGLGGMSGGRASTVIVRRLYRSSDAAAPRRIWCATMTRNAPSGSRQSIRPAGALGLIDRPVPGRIARQAGDVRAEHVVGQIVT